MDINFIANTLEYDGKIFDLDDVRKFILREYETLCANNFIKAIIKNGRRIFTYDWETIFMLSKQLGIIDLFYKRYNHKAK